MNVIRGSFENEIGKYKFFTTEDAIMEIMKHNELFNSKFVDAKNGDVIIHRERIIEALGIQPPETNQ